MTVALFTLMLSGLDYSQQVTDWLRTLSSVLESRDTVTLRISYSRKSSSKVVEDLSYILIKSPGSVLLKCKYFTCNYTIDASNNGVSTVIAFPQGSAFCFCPDIRYNGSVRTLIDTYQCYSLDYLSILTDVKVMMLSKALSPLEHGGNNNTKYVNSNRDTICEMQINGNDSYISYSYSDGKAGDSLSIKISYSTKNDNQEIEKLHSAIREAKDSNRVMKLEYSKGEKYPDLFMSMCGLTSVRTLLSKYDLATISKKITIRFPSDALIEKYKVRNLKTYAYVGSLNTSFDINNVSFTVSQMLDALDSETIKRFTQRKVAKDGIELSYVVDPASKTEYTYILIDKSYLIVPNTKPDTEGITTIVDLFKTSITLPK